MNAPDGIRFRSKDERTLPLYALMNKAVNDYIKAITHICENDALDKCADILELHGWTKQRTGVYSVEDLKLAYHMGQVDLHYCRSFEQALKEIDRRKGLR